MKRICGLWTIIVLLHSPLAVFAETIRLSGSDLLPQAWVEHLKAEATGQGLSLQIHLGGTLEAERRMEGGTADVAIIAVPDGSEIPPELRRIPVAYQVVIVAVHRNNPVSFLTYANLRSIFGSAGRANQWGGFTSEPGWGNRNINAGILRRDNNLAHEIFSHYVLEGQTLRLNLTFAQNTQTLLNLITDDVASLVVMPATDLGGVARALPIARATGSQAFSPTPDNVMFGDYPLRLPFYIVWNANSNPPGIGTLMRILLSDSSSEVMSRHLFTPLPETERRSYLLEFAP